MAATPALLQSIVDATSPESLEWKPSDEAWSTRDVLAHLLYVETAVIGERIRRMVEEENPPLGAAPRPTSPENTLRLVQSWLAAREANLRYLGALTPDQLDRTGRHPRYGPISVREHVVEWAYHDLDHLRQILAALQSGLYPDIGPFQALYPKPS